MSQASSLNIVFAGTPEFAARHLQALINSPHNIVAVYTQPDRPKGRGKKLSASPVKQLADKHQLLVLQPPSLKNDEAQQQLATLKPDLMIVVAYGLLLPQAVLDTPRYGCLNVHGSILPRWRGAAPIQRAIETGDARTGITIMQMDIGLDTGPMLLKIGCDISPEDTSSSLHDKLAELGPPALLETLQRLMQGSLRPEAQDDTLANYASKITKTEAEINWRLSAEQIQRKLRAFNPFPIAFTTLKGERLRLHSAKCSTLAVTAQPGTVLQADRDQFSIACGEGSLHVTQVQLPGKKVMSLAEFANGHSQYCPPGTILGEQPL